MLMKMLTKHLLQEDQDIVPFATSIIEQLQTSTFDLPAREEAFHMAAVVGQKLRRHHQHVVDTSCAHNHQLQSCHLHVEDFWDEHDVEVVSDLVDVVIG